jgi:hypothetical protein
MLGNLIVDLFNIALLAYVIMQIYALVKMRGRYRKLAMIPLLMFALVIAYIIGAVYLGSNIAPVIVIFVAPIAFMYMLILMIMWRKASL